MVFLRGLFCAESRQNPAESPETKTCVQNQRNSGKNFSFLCGETAQRAQTPPSPEACLAAEHGKPESHRKRRKARKMPEMRTFAQKKHPVSLSSAKTVALRTACFQTNDVFCTIRQAQTQVKTKKLPGNRTAFYLISSHATWLPAASLRLPCDLKRFTAP